MTRNHNLFGNRDRSTMQIVLLVAVPWLCLVPSLWLILG
jgi:hypothetical protein